MKFITTSEPHQIFYEVQIQDFRLSLPWEYAGIFIGHVLLYQHYPYTKQS